MTDKVNISPGHTNVPESTAETFAYGVGEWVQPSSGTLIASYYSGLNAGPYNAFNHTGTSGHDVTIDTGEGVIGGACLARDTTTVVTLAASTANQTVYVGWEPSAQDSIVIGKSGAFTSSARKLAVWEFDTDGSTVTNATDLRPLGPQLDRQNTRYETSDGSGAQVDDAAALNGKPPGNYARTDIAETFSANTTVEDTLGIDAEANGFKQTLGSQSGETSRVAGSTSDLLVQVQGGQGRVAHAWNAYYDNVDNVWRTIVANEGHSLISWNGYDPGPGGTTGNIVFGTAPSNGTADATINWNLVILHEDGDLEIAGASVMASPDRDKIRVFEGTSEPAGATTGDWWVDTS